MNKTNYHNCTCKSAYILLHLQSSNMNFFERLNVAKMRCRLLLKIDWSVLLSSCLKDAEKLHLLLGSIFPRGNKIKKEFLHGVFVVDVPVVPAGAIVLKYSITPILFWDLALLARHRIHRCVFGTGFSRSAGVNCRHSWNWTTISLGSLRWDWMHWRTSWGRARDFSRN